MPKRKRRPPPQIEIARQYLTRIAGIDARLEETVRGVPILKVHPGPERDRNERIVVCWLGRTKTWRVFSDTPEVPPELHGEGPESSYQIRQDCTDLEGLAEAVRLALTARRTAFNVGDKVEYTRKNGDTAHGVVKVVRVRGSDAETPRQMSLWRTRQLRGEQVAYRLTLDHETQRKVAHPVTVAHTRLRLRS